MNHRLIYSCVIFILCTALIGPAAFAQLPRPMSEEPEGEVLREPICSALINRSDQTILGTLSTAPQEAASGDKIAHRDNFRLASGEKKEFCVSGPFYEGRRIKLVIRTLMPLFECKTRVEEPVYLDAEEGDNGMKKLSATCR